MIEIRFKNTKGYDESIVQAPIIRTVYTSDSPLAGENRCIGIVSRVDNEYVYGFLFADFHEWKNVDRDRVTSLELIFDGVKKSLTAAAVRD